jgi:DNA-binding Lrp family transcriptional regulator
MVKIDKIDEWIVTLLSQDGRASATQILKELKEKRIPLTSRSVLNRIRRLEKYGVIQGYNARLSPALFEGKENVMILLKFVPFPDNANIMRLNSYLRGLPFCFFATQMNGGEEGYDYACHLVFNTKQQFDCELNSILRISGNLIAYYHVCKLKIFKETTRVLPSTHDLGEAKMSNSVNEQTLDELEGRQNLISRCIDDMAKSALARFGYH